MSFTERYLRLLLHLVLWWTVLAYAVLSVIAFCMLLDWFGHVGWGYPWYAGVLVAATFLFVYGVRRLARLGLRAVKEGPLSLLP